MYFIAKSSQKEISPNYTPNLFYFLQTCILFFCLFNSSKSREKEMQLIYPLISSADGFTNLEITRDHIPESFFESPLLTFLYELTIEPKVILAGVNNIRFMTDHDPEKSESIELDFLNHLFTLGKSQIVLSMNPVHTNFGASNHTLTFILSVEVDFTAKTCRLFYHSFSPNYDEFTFSQRRYEIAFKRLDPGNPTLFTLNAYLLSTTSTKIRNLTVFRNPLDTSDPTFPLLIGGVASLAQSVYFYMEASNTKFLLNRSKFNVPPAISGLPERFLGGLNSIFSESTLQVEWMMSTNNFEFLHWKLPIIQLNEALSFSTFVSLKIFLRNSDLTDYLSSLGNKKTWLVHFTNHVLDFLISVNIQFKGVTFENGVIDLSYSLLFQDENDQILLKQDFTEKLSPYDLDLKISSLQIIFYQTVTSTLVIQSVVRFSDDRPPRISGISATSVSDAQFILTDVIIGCKFFRSNFLKPPFFIVLFDLQMFWGSFFLKSSADPDLLLALSKEDSHSVVCKSNPYLIRKTNNMTMDLIHKGLLETYPLCKDQIFGRGCSVPHCEICALDRCFVCKSNFSLVANECIDHLLSMDDLSFDPLNRRLSMFSSSATSPLMFFVRGVQQEVISNSNPLVFWLSFDHSELAATEQSIHVQIDSFNSSLPNPYTLHPHLRHIYSVSSQTVYFDFFHPTTTNTVELLSYNFDMNSKIKYLTQLCSENKNTPLLRNSFRSMACNDNINLSSFSYMTNSNSDVLPNGYSNTVYYESGFVLKDVTFTSPCLNNCNCSGNSFLSENSCPVTDSCEKGFFLFDYVSSKELNSCVQCPEGCQECVQNLCTQWTDSRLFYKEEYTLSQYPNLKFKRRQRCHASCEFGCIGNGFKDCKKCPDDCFICDANFSCICYKKSHLVVKEVDTDFDVCVQEECVDNCRTCSQESKCVECRDGYVLVGGIQCKPIFKKPNYCKKFSESECLECEQKYFLAENTCKKCPSNCLTCSPSEPQMKCSKCQPGHHLSPSNQCFRIPVQKNRPSLQLHISSVPAFQSLPVISSNSLCPKKKFSFVNKCESCNNPFFLNINQECVQCPFLSLECAYIQSLYLLKIIKCPDSTFVNNSINECTKCSDPNCQTCDERKCLMCSPGFSAFGLNCFACHHPNCVHCSVDGTCIHCEAGFYLTSQNKCIKCPENCKKCSSPNLCLECDSFFSLNETSSSEIGCIPNNLSPTPNNCEFCKCYNHQSPNKSCPNCSKCKKNCSVYFDFSTEKNFIIYSPHLQFTDPLSYSFSPPLKVSPVLQLDGSIKIPLPDLYAETTVTFPRQSFSTLDCLYVSDLSLVIKSILPEKKPSIDLTYHYQMAEVYTLAAHLGVSFFFTNVDLSSILVLININNFFKYSFIFGINHDNFIFHVFSKVFKDDSMEISWYPITKAEFLYFGYRIKNHMLFLKPFFTFSIYQMFTLVLLMISIYGLKIYFKKFRKKSISLPKKRSLKRPSRRSSLLFKIIIKLKKIKMYSWIQRGGEQIKYREKQIYFIIFQSQCSHLCHQCALSLLFVKQSTPNFSLSLICLTFHLCIFSLICYFTYRFVKLGLIFHRKKVLSTKHAIEYVSLCKNLSIVLAESASIYILVLLGNARQPVYLLSFVLFSYLLHLYIANQVTPIFRPLYAIRNSLLAFPIISLVLASFRASEELNACLSLYFVMVNVLGAIILILELSLRVNKKWVNFLTSR